MSNYLQRCNFVGYTCNLSPKYKNQKYCVDHCCIEYGCNNVRVQLTANVYGIPLLSEYCECHNSSCTVCNKIVYKNKYFCTNTLHFGCACITNVCKNPKTCTKNDFCIDHTPKTL